MTKLLNKYIDDPDRKARHDLSGSFGFQAQVIHDITEHTLVSSMFNNPVDTGLKGLMLEVAANGVDVKALITVTKLQAGLEMTAGQQLVHSSAEVHYAGDDNQLELASNVDKLLRDALAALRFDLAATMM